MKLTRAEVKYRYQGEFEGESTVQYLVNYRDEGTGQSVALERLKGLRPAGSKLRGIRKAIRPA